MNKKHFKLSTLAFTVAAILNVPAFAADLPLDTPTEDFTINNDGTVLHKKTGLTWQRCAVGQTWNAKTATCDGTTSTMTWDDAMASYYTGKTCDDWRLPRIDELNSIVEHGTYNPAINSTIFSNTTTDNYFWSASVYPDNTSVAWFIRFGYGASDFGGKSNSTVGIRLVRGIQPCSVNSLNTSPSVDFIDNKDGTVTHKKTGLMWQRCSIGQTWNGTTCTGLASTMTWDNATKQSSSFANYNDWRLPTQKELQTIVEYGNYNPAINISVFPNTPSVWFLSSSPHADYTGILWFVSFRNGYNGFDSKDGRYAVRFVRDEQQSSFFVSSDLLAAISASSNRIGQNQNITYTATAQNSGDGTANNVALKFILPPRWTKTISLPADCKFDGTLTVCNVGTLAAGAKVSRSIVVSFSKFRGATTVGALVTTESEDTNLGNNMGQIVTTVGK